MAGMTEQRDLRAGGIVSAAEALAEIQSITDDFLAAADGFRDRVRGNTPQEVEAAFERAADRHIAELEAERATAWDMGHDAGWSARHDDALSGWMPSGPHESDAVNPYRKGPTE